MDLIPIEAGGVIGSHIGELPPEAGFVIQATCDLYKAVGFSPPWICYMAMENGVAVGTCGFKSPPSNGRVEIAYFTFPPFEGKGIATAGSQDSAKRDGTQSALHGGGGL
jgi:ribosomal-protein-alanine N-acetyltransferase